MISDLKSTIIAPATPPGEGGVGIIRLSGPLAEDALLRFFSPSRCLSVAALKSHRLYHGYLRNTSGVLIDEVMAVIMRSPHSFTREDVAEIHCHGGQVIMQQILDLFLGGEAVRLARPGEFTLRAFLNGRLDLTQAEAVADIIRSRSSAACTVALGQLEGRLSRIIYQFRDELANLLALVEVYIDFPEEDIEWIDLQNIVGRGRSILAEMERLLATFDEGKVLKEGLSVLILGRPNVGKSSLLNALLGEARAIVTDVPGTTRDTIEASLTMKGLHLRLVDTAGIRHTSDLIEAEGVRRAREKISSADLVLFVMDGSVSPTADDYLAFSACANSRSLLVVNKCDLPPTPLAEPFSSLPAVYISTHSGHGLAELTQRIASLFSSFAGDDGHETFMISDRRHREALLRAHHSLFRFCDAAEQEVSPEFLAVELRDALRSIGEITGETTPDEILDRIFSRFCIGK